MKLCWNEALTMDKIIERKLKLIHLLYSYTTFVSAYELGNAMGLTDKTIHSEVSILSDYLKETNYGLEIIKKKSTYYLKRETIHYLEGLLLTIKQESTSFLVTKNLFDNKTSLKSIFKEHHYNVSYYYKSMHIYRQQLQPFCLDFTSSPAEFIGEEHLIRTYLYFFFWDHYGKIEWPFQHLKKEQALEIVKKIAHTISISFTKAEQLKVAYWVAITMKRTKNQHYLSPIPIKEERPFIRYTDANHWLDLFFPFQIKPTEEVIQQETRFIFSTLLVVLDAENFETMIEAGKIEYQDGDILDLSLQFCKNIENYFPFKSSINGNTILYAVYRIFYKHILLKGTFESNELVFLPKIEYQKNTLYNETYNKFISDIIHSSRSFSALKTKKILWDDLSSIVGSVTDLTHYQPKFTVLLNLTLGKLEELFVMDYLNKLNYTLLFERSPGKPIDLIITDSYFEKNLTLTPYFLWNDGNLVDNLSRLTTFLETISLSS